MSNGTTMLKEKIIKLRDQGKSYQQIATELSCSKSTVCYHLGDNQPSKNYVRTKRNRTSCPIKQKMYDFQRVKFNDVIEPKKALRRRNRLQRKVYSFMKSDKSDTATFTLEQLLETIGDNPVCYLTGEPIDINKPKTYELDHIIPVSRGGDSSLANLGICTKAANRAKGNMTPEEFISLCKSVTNHNK